MQAYLVHYHAWEYWSDRNTPGHTRQYDKTMLVGASDIVEAARQAGIRLEEMASNCGAQVRYEAEIEAMSVIKADYYFFDQAEEPEREDSPCPGA